MLGIESFTNDGAGLDDTNKKRKLDFTSDDIIWEEIDRPLKKNKKNKKKKKSKGPQGSEFKVNHGSSNQFNFTPEYVEVNAKPEELPPTPNIFIKKKKKKSKKKKKKKNGQFSLEDHITSNIITNKSFDPDVENRFTNFVNLKPKSKNKKKKNKNDSSKKDDASKKLEETDKNESLPKQNEQDSEPSVSTPSETEEKSPRNETEEKSSRNETEEQSSRNETTDLELIDLESSVDEVSFDVDMYKVPQKEAVVFHMHYPCEFTFEGEIKFTLITGKIEIFGYILKSTSPEKTVTISSPSLYVPIVIECRQHKQNVDKNMIQEKLKDLKDKDVEKILSNLRPDDTILQIEKYTSWYAITLNSYFKKSIFPKDMVDFSSLSDSLEELQDTFHFKRNLRRIHKNPEWDSIILDQCVVVCGGPGVGKSTLLRYLSNKCVGRNEKVLWIELDPGQPEFTPPGFVSAVIVDKPLFGPSFTHMFHSEVMIFYGNVDVSKSPKRYFECVKELLKMCRAREELSNMRWFVNTMGFNKGIGVTLMVAVLKILKPNVMIQVESSIERRNYPFTMKPVYVNDYRIDWPEFQKVEDISFEFYVMESKAEKNQKIIKGALSNKFHRDILFLIYFSRTISPPYFTFNAVQPYIISFSQVYLVVDSMIAPANILKAFNGNIVSLIHFEPGSEETFLPETEKDKDDFFKIIVKPQIRPALGAGFIRGIDVQKKIFYVNTPLSEEKLEEVNCFCLGKLIVPLTMYLNQSGVSGQPVYTTLSTIDNIQKVDRLFRFQIKKT